MRSTAITSGPEFDAFSYEEGRNWELLGGELIAVSSPTPEHQLILQRILLTLMLHLDAHPGCGIAFTDVEFALTENYRVRPDVLVLLQPGASSLDLTKIPVPGSPDLAVEIISPTERSSETQQKLQAYLQHGTREVWQVYPKSQLVVVHRGEMINIRSADERVTTEMLPGFSLSVGSLFAKVKL